eukprot:5283441-Amphidinium_carterae.1
MALLASARNLSNELPYALLDMQGRAPTLLPQEEEEDKETDGNFIGAGVCTINRFQKAVRCNTSSAGLAG